MKIKLKETFADTISGKKILAEIADKTTNGLNIDDSINGLNTSITTLSSNINTISGDLVDTKEIVNELTDEVDYLSDAIDTKQHRLSAGQYVELVENDDYDTINITGINPSTFFTAQMNKHSSSEYFTFDGHTLSASDKVGFFNLSIGYKVNTTNACVDDYYSTIIKVNNDIVDTHYINGAIPNENHYISKNVLNNNNNLYEFTIEKDAELNISDMNITCIGFIGESNDINLGVLGTNGNILTFGNTILRV